MAVPTRRDKMISNLMKLREKRKERQTKNKERDEKSTYYSLKWDYEKGQLPATKMSLFKKLRARYEKNGQ